MVNIPIKPDAKMKKLMDSLGGAILSLQMLSSAKL